MADNYNLYMFMAALNGCQGHLLQKCISSAKHTLVSLFLTCLFGTDCMSTGFHPFIKARIYIMQSEDAYKCIDGEACATDAGWCSYTFTAVSALHSELGVHW